MRQQVRKIDADPVLVARVKADLRQSRTPRQIAGRLHLEVSGATVELMNASPEAHGAEHDDVNRQVV